MEQLFAPNELPPAGHARDEELKRRTDNLEEQAAEQYANVGSISQKSLEPDREIRAAIARSYLEIGINHPFLKVKWVNYISNHGSMVWSAKADGWQIATVQDFPEARELVREDNTIRVGDVMLMAIRMDRHLQIEEREKNKRLRQQFGVEAEIHDLADKVNRKEGREVFKNINTPEINGMDDKLMGTIEQRAARHSAAKRTALKHLGNRMKQGVIPGVPIR